MTYGDLTRSQLEQLVSHPRYAEWCKEAEELRDKLFIRMQSDIDKALTPKEEGSGN